MLTINHYFKIIIYTNKVFKMICLNIKTIRWQNLKNIIKILFNNNRIYKVNKK